jgi:hypothetical protein
MRRLRFPVAGPEGDLHRVCFHRLNGQSYGYGGETSGDSGTGRAAVTVIRTRIRTRLQPYAFVRRLPLVFLAIRGIRPSAYGVSASNAGGLPFDRLKAGRNWLSRARLTKKDV